MPVYDIAAGQKLASPIRSYYQGKALRADTELREKQAIALQQEIDANLPERSMAAEEGRLEVAQNQETRLREAWDASKDEAEKQKFINILDASEATYQNSIASGMSEADARSASYEVMLDEADRLNGEGTRAEAEAQLAEQGFTPDMWDPVRVRGVLGIRPAPKGKPTILSKGAIAIDPDTGEVIASNESSPSDKRSARYQQAIDGGLKPGTEEFNKFVLNESSGKGPTAAQSKAAGFAIRVEDANKVLNDLEKEYEKGGYFNKGDFTNALDRFTGSRFMPQGLKSDERQKFEQAQRNFINAILRRESGAAIAPSEFESAELQYFPVPGDSKAVVKQKTRNREVVQALLASEAGPAFQLVRNQLEEMPNYLTGDRDQFEEPNIDAAPQAALEFLEENPEMIDAFEEKYGYRPEGY